jgi:hypothetical protein
MPGIDSTLSADDARTMWATLGSEGKAPTSLTSALRVLPYYSVGIDEWIERLARTYLRDLAQRSAHFKLVIAPYGGGKTHFLMSVGGRALQENFAVSCVACTQGASFDNPLALYRAFIKDLNLPGRDRPGLRTLLRCVLEFKTKQMRKSEVPDIDRAMAEWLRMLSREDYPENQFARVMAEALRGIQDPDGSAIGDAAFRWLCGDINTLTKEDLTALRLAKISARDAADFGRNLFLSLVRFAKDHGGVSGVVILFDEVETLFSAKGKALLRVLAAMRVMLDMPTGVHGGVPLLGLFSAVPDVMEILPRYPALEQRLAVRGGSFEEGADLAAQLRLDKLGSQEDLLFAIGERLVALGELARGHEFSREIQSANVRRLAKVATDRNLDINARRLFVKAWVNVLDLQADQGERAIDEQEFIERYRGSFEGLRHNDERESDL